MRIYIYIYIYICVYVFYVNKKKMIDYIVYSVGVCWDNCVGIRKKKIINCIWLI